MKTVLLWMKEKFKVKFIIKKYNNIFAAMSLALLTRSLLSVSTNWYLSDENSRPRNCWMLLMRKLNEDELNIKGGQGS